MSRESAFTIDFWLMILNDFVSAGVESGDLFSSRTRVVSPAPTAAPTPTPMQAQVPSAGCVGSSLSPGKGLNVGQWLCSTDGRFLLSMQSDGNLVIYQGSAAIWASNTGGR
jgi:hypothetical protein